MNYGNYNGGGQGGGFGGGGGRAPNPMFQPLFVKFPSGDKAKVGYVTLSNGKNGQPMVTLTIDLKGQPAGIQGLMAALNVSDPQKGLKLWAYVPQVPFSRGGGGARPQGGQNWQSHPVPQQAPYGAGPAQVPYGAGMQTQPGFQQQAPVYATQPQWGPAGMQAGPPVVAPQAPQPVQPTAAPAPQHPPAPPAETRRPAANQTPFDDEIPF